MNAYDYTTDPGFPHTMAGSTQVNMTTQLNDDLSLQLFLAGRLADKLWLFREPGRFYWNDGLTNHEVKDTEWLSIAAMVESQLEGDIQKTRYVFELVQVQGVGIGFEWAVVHASWQDKARALRKVLT